jgi:hypothetical protein
MIVRGRLRGARLGKLVVRLSSAAVGMATLALIGGSDAARGSMETCDRGCDLHVHAAASAAPIIMAKGGRFATLPDVSLAPRVADKLARIADHYHRRTGKTLVVTSGTRDPESQAEAIYDKLTGGDDIIRLYRNKSAALEVKAAFEKNRARGKAVTIAAMEATLKKQIARGVFISSHLRAGAADIRSTDMTPIERRTFVDGALSTKGISVMYEAIPPHFHVQLE